MLKRDETGLLPWFGVRVRSNYERVAALHMRDRGFEEYNPVCQTVRQWSDRKKVVEQALFPGYVFCRLNYHDRLPVLSIPGVVGLVGFANQPCPIPEAEIDSVRQMMDSGSLVMPWPFLRPGQAVMMSKGPLAGLEGTLLQVKGKFRLVVSLTLLQRSVAAEVDRQWVTPVNSTSAHSGNFQSAGRIPGVVELAS